MIAPYTQEYIKNAIFLSYSALTDYSKCPRSYYLKHVYREPKEGYRLQIVSPYLTLGITVHDAIKWYFQSSDKLTLEAICKEFRSQWKKFRSKRGGFTSIEEEAIFGKRGLAMLANFYAHADQLEPKMPPLSFPKVKLTDTVILIGNFDFVGACAGDTLHVMDLKTGVHEEDDALQLHIYAILAEANYQRAVSKASFWYLDKYALPTEVTLEPLQPKLEWLIEKGLDIKRAREDNHWICIKAPQLCWECRAYQLLIDGKGEYLYTDYQFKRVYYFLD